MDDEAIGIGALKVPVTQDWDWISELNVWVAQVVASIFETEGVPVHALLL